MIIQRIHEQIKFRFNKLNSNHKQDLFKQNIDDAINKCLADYVEIFYSGNSMKPYKFGFEVTQQQIDMLQTLVVPEVELPLNLVSPGIYTGGLAFLPRYKHFIRGHVVPTECNTKRIPIIIVRHNDLDFKLKNENQKPSLLWERVLGVIKNNSLHLYTNGDFTISKCIVEYLKYPANVFYGGYDSLEYLQGDTDAFSAADPSQDPEIPESYHDLLIDMVVQYLNSVIQDQPLNKNQINNLI